MNEPTEASPRQPEEKSHAAAPFPAERSLTAALVEDGDAVHEDLRLANEVAAQLETRLAGKSKELMHLKFLLEQTKASFGHMQDSVAAMRKERHKLANDAMRAQGLEMMLARVTAERDRVTTEHDRMAAELARVTAERDRGKNELEGILEGLAAEKAEQAHQGLRFDKRDHRIAELTFELMQSRQEVAGLRRAIALPPPAAAAPPPEPCAPEPRLAVETVVPADLEIVPTEWVGVKRTMR